MQEDRSIKDFIQQLEKKLQLNFIQEEEGNVCMANRNSELRDEFKVSFTKADVLNYIKAVKTSDGTIPLPENEEAFWKIVNSASD